MKLPTVLLSSLIACFLALDPTLGEESELKWEWVAQMSGVETSIRGLCAVDADICWFGTGNGTVGRTIDGGKTWETLEIDGAEALDFRDVEAFDADRCVAMSVGEGEASRLYRTTDGGKNWQLVYQNKAAAGFFNGIAFWDESNGILAGDPVDGRLFVLRTSDGGASWKRIEATPTMQSGEHAFAASGTHVTVAEGGHVWVGSGGEVARIVYSSDFGKNWSVVDSPMIAGEPSTGIFSIAFKNPKEGIAVGGDYKKESEGTRNTMTTSDGGKTWKLMTNGDGLSIFSFRSCVRFTSKSKSIIAVGPSGSNVLLGGSKIWRNIEGPGFHVVSVVEGLSGAWAAGSEGRIARLR